MLFQSAVVPRQCLADFFLLLIVMALCLSAQGQVALTQISSDPFTNPDSQHATEVEASAFSWGNTIVTAFQQGRFDNFGGASDNGFATSTDAGVTWTSGSLPGLTVNSGGTALRASDPNVAYDANHGVWLIASLPHNPGGNTISHPMLVSRSFDGGLTWNDPVTVGPTYSYPDKEWLSCDNNVGSPYYGNCYAEWDVYSTGDLLYFAVSSDGGLTFSTPVQPSGDPAGFGVQPLSQPNGTVIAVGGSTSGTMIAVISRDGGATFPKTVTISPLIAHYAAGLLRDTPLPSSATDAAGTVYTVWQDCRFYSGCQANNLVMSTSTDGVTWSAVSRIPIGSNGGTMDVFIPGLAIEPGTSGSTAHLGLTFYFYADRDCTVATCQLQQGYVSSHDGGTTWSAFTTLAGPMNDTWFPVTNAGFMPGDYTSVAFVNGAALPVVGLATSRAAGDPYNVTMNVPTTPLTDGPDMFSSVGERPVPGAHSDYPPRTKPVCDNCDDED